MQHANALLIDDKRLHEMGECARAFAQRQHGATMRTLELLVPLIGDTRP